MGSFAGFGRGMRLSGGVPRAGFRTRSADCARTGTICATGVSRSRTAMVSPHRTKILAKLGFQFRDTHLLHYYMITRISHSGKRPPDLWNEPQMCWDKYAQRSAHDVGSDPRKTRKRSTPKTQA